STHPTIHQLPTRRSSELCRDVVHLRRRLVVPRAPRLAAVDADDRPLIARERDDVRIVRVDPAALIVVASRRAADAAPRLAAVDRSEEHTSELQSPDHLVY